MYTYLALGDSYTIGEQVAPEENFPHQFSKLMSGHYGIPFADPRIIAVTGWTTDELAAAIEAEKITETYDFVTLLIGVNNQYRGRNLEEYKAEFTTLLQQAILFANGRSSHVCVLSIPDWGVTPFAEGRDRASIAEQIDAFNNANKAIAGNHRCLYLDITESTRQHGTDLAYLTPDKLHYAGKEYALWAAALAEKVQPVL